MMSLQHVRGCALVIIGGLAVFVPASASADVVYLRNGDRISGTVDHFAEEYLELRVPHGDDGDVTLKIKVREIVSIQTEKQVEVQLDDGTRFKARLERVPDGGVVVRPADETARTIPLSRLAYINPDAEESGVGVDWRGRVSAGVTDTSGNSDTKDAYLEGELEARAKQWRWKSNARGKYAQQSGTTTAGSWLVGTRYDWLFTERQYLYARATAQRDTFSNIALRWTAGAGYGYKILESDRTNLELRASLDHVTTQRVVPPDQNYLAIGWGIDLDHWLVRDRLQFFFGQEGFVDPKSDEGTIIRSQTGFRAPVIDDLSANVQLNVDYNSDPGPGFDTTDRTFILGLGYSF
jgi:putative salt-induced outer membrane protein YdiY